MTNQNNANNKKHYPHESNTSYTLLYIKITYLYYRVTHIKLLYAKILSKYFTIDNKETGELW